MDFLPIQRASTNKVDTSINLANDGGSKSNTGYMNQRGHKEEAPEIQEKGDEVQFSHGTHHEEFDEEEEFNKSLSAYLIRVKDFILKLFGIKKKKIKNPFEQRIN